MFYQPQEAFQLGWLMFHEVSLQLAEGCGEIISRVTVAGLDQTLIDHRVWLASGN